MNGGPHAPMMYRNPIYTRGFLVLPDGGMVTAYVRGGPLDGLRIAVQHVWTLGRRPVELAGTVYQLETDDHGFVFKWVNEEAIHGA